MDYYDYVMIMVSLPWVVLVNLNWSVNKSDHVTLGVFNIYWFLWLLSSVRTKQINTTIFKKLWLVAEVLTVLCSWIDHYGRNYAQQTNETLWKISHTLWSMTWFIFYQYRRKDVQQMNKRICKIIETLWSVTGLLICLHSCIDDYDRNDAKQTNATFWKVNKTLWSVAGLLILLRSWIHLCGKNDAQQTDTTIWKIKQTLWSVTGLILLCSWIDHYGRNDGSREIYRENDGSRGIYSGRDLFLFVSLVRFYKVTMNQTFQILTVFSSCIHGWFCKYGARRIVVYVSVLIVHATIITFILVKGVTAFYVVVANALSQEQYLYINASLENALLYESMNPSANIIAHEHRVYIVNDTNTNWINNVIYYSGDAPKNKHSVEGRVARRFPGEDIDLLCEMTYTRPINSWSEPRVAWIKDGERLDLTYRHDLKTSISCKKNWIRVVSKLRILFIQESDYGTYNCTLQQVVWKGDDSMSMPYLELVVTVYLVTEFEQCGCDNDAFHEGEKHLYLHEVTHHAAVWRLEKSVPVTEYAIASIGTVLWHYETFVYMAFAESEHIEVEYTINNIPYNETCIGALQGCSLSAWFYTHYFRGNRVSLMEISHQTVKDNLSYFLVFFSTCVCPESYGEHKVSFYRHHYNASLKENLLMEVTHPKTLFVYPDNNTLSTFRSKHANYSDISSKFAKESGLWDIEWFRNILRYQEEILWYIDNVIDHVIAFISILFLYYTTHIWRLYTKYFVIPLEHRIFHGRWTPDIAHDIRALVPLGEIYDFQNGETLFESDVFISNCKEDEEFVENVLVPQLESWGLKVYFHKRDAVLGGFKFKIISEAMCKSRKIIAVLSQNYQNERMVNGFQMNCILTLYYDKKMSGENILLLKYRPCEIPRVLFWDKAIIVQDWTTNALSREDKIRQIRMWVFGRLIA